MTSTRELAIQFLAEILRSSQELVRKELEAAKPTRNKTRHTEVMDTTDNYQVWVERAKRILAHAETIHYETD